MVKEKLKEQSDTHTRLFTHTHQVPLSFHSKIKISTQFLTHALPTLTSWRFLSHMSCTYITYMLIELVSTPIIKLSTWWLFPGCWCSLFQWWECRRNIHRGSNSQTTQQFGSDYLVVKGESINCNELLYKKYFIFEDGDTQARLPKCGKCLIKGISLLIIFPNHSELSVSYSMYVMFSFQSKKKY